MPTATAARPALGPQSGRIRALHDAANRPVVADSVAAARIAFGAMVLYSSWRFVAKGWVESLYLAPDHHLTYAGFGWVEPWPAPFMYGHVIGLGLLGIAIAVGYRARLAAALFVVGFGYIELIDAALYLNHYWFLTLSGVLMALLPVSHHWSIDARRGALPRSSTVPVVVVWVLRAQIAVVYFFAGLAKVNSDWLFHAQPLRLWFADRTTWPLLGAVLNEPAVAFVASWAALFFDLTIVGWLLWRRSRRLAFGAVVGFHLLTGWLFPIGVFPLVMMASTLIFFDPNWPSSVLTRLRLMPRAAVGDTNAIVNRASPTIAAPIAAVLVLLGAIQIALPLRHYAYSGNVRATEEGYYLAWRVMLTEKTGYSEFRVTDPTTDRTWLVGPELVLTDWQATQAQIRPDLIHATAKLIADYYEPSGSAALEVRVDAFVSMNGGRAQRLIDPTVDLAAVSRSPAPSPWILPIR